MISGARRFFTGGRRFARLLVGPRHNDLQVMRGARREHHRHSQINVALRNGHASVERGVGLVRYAGLYARNVKRQCADLARAALEALRTQFPLWVMVPLAKFFKSPKWRERIKQSFGYDPLLCPRR